MDKQKKCAVRACTGKRNTKSTWKRMRKKNKKVEDNIKHRKSLNEKGQKKHQTWEKRENFAQSRSAQLQPDKRVPEVSRARLHTWRTR
jgi:hypothetical protein